MARQERGVQVRQAIIEAAARLEARPGARQNSIAGPAPGDLYVFETPVEAVIEWLVVRFHVDDSATLLLAPADDFPLAGQCDVGLWPEFLDRPLTVRSGEAVWVPASLCADYLRVGSVLEDAVSEVRRLIAGLARGNAPNDPVRERAEADPEYMAWLDQVAVARQALEDRADCEPAAPEGAILKFAELSNSPPAWLAPEAHLALAASPGGGLMADLRESLASASSGWAEVPLQTGGALLLAADAGGVRVCWRGPKDAAPPQLIGFGSAGRQAAKWTNGERPDLHRAEPDFGWLDGQVVLQAGDGNPQTLTVRL